MRLLARVFGVLLTLAGCVWILQGVGLLPGSFMSGQTKWAVNGAIAVVIGVGILWLAGRRSAP